MKKVRLLKAADVYGQKLDAGTEMLLDENMANMLINGGKAVAVEEKKDPAGSGDADPAGEGVKAGDELIDPLSKSVSAAVKTALEPILSAHKELMSKLPRIEVIDREDPQGGFKNFGHFLRDCVKAETSGRRSETLVKYLDGVEKKEKALRQVMGKDVGDLMMAGDDAQGGFLAPAQYRASLLTTALETAFFYPKTQFIPMATGAVKIPAIFDTDHSEGEFYGGVQIVRVEEGGQKTESKPKTGLVELNLHEVAGLVYVTNTLLEDSMISVEAILNSLFGQAIAFVIDDDCLNGNGAARPQGVLNSPALVTITRQGAGIVALDIFNMWASLFPASMGRAIWVYNHELFPLVASMLIGTIPAYMPANGVSGKPYDTLMGKPAFKTEKVPSKDNKGSMVLVDPGMYLLGGKAGLNVKTDMSIHIRFDKNQTCFRFTIRYDGKGWWKESLKPKNGSPDFRLSPFVTLDAPVQ